MQEIYGLHAIPSSLGFAISKLPPFGRHRRRARRWRPEKQMAEPNLGNRVAGNIVFFWVAPVASFLFQCPQQTTKPTKKIMNKNHNAAATQRHQNLAFFFLCASHRSKAVERTFEEVRSQRREKFMHCFQQVQITQPSSEKTGGLGQGGWQCFFFLWGKIWWSSKWSQPHVVHLWYRNISPFQKNFQWYIFQNTSERDSVLVWGSEFDIHLLVNMHTTHPGKLAWQWTKTSNRRCISCHTWWF